jgi:hypothetical protein
MIDTLVVPALAVLLWFWSSLGVRCVVSVRVRETFNPARYASNGCSRDRRRTPEAPPLAVALPERPVRK